MKRSRINALLEEAKNFFAERRFHLPPWAFWSPGDWRARIAEGPQDCREILDNMLGWDITDFGGGDFERRGLVLFTLRNGNPERDAKVYAEKIMIVGEGQETPWHFHWNKMEDIINRGGGNLVLELRASDPVEGFSEAPLEVRVDGIVRRVPAGGRVVLTPGESICLTPGMYHRFFGAAGRGRVLVGEVSRVNDDRTDNRFHEQVGRFPEPDEDEPPCHLLAADYAKWLGGPV